MDNQTYNDEDTFWSDEEGEKEDLVPWKQITDISDILYSHSPQMLSLPTISPHDISYILSQNKQRNMTEFTLYKLCRAFIDIMQYLNITEIDKEYHLSVCLYIRQV